MSAFSKKLQDSQINMESLYILARAGGYSIHALKVDKPKKAASALSAYLVREK